MKLNKELQIKLKKLYIKTFDTLSYAQIAKMHGVAASSISRLAAKENWVKAREDHWKRQGKLAKVNIENEEEFLFWKNQHVLDNAEIIQKLKREFIKNMDSYFASSKDDHNQFMALLKTFQNILTAELYIYGPVQEIIADWRNQQDDSLEQFADLKEIAAEIDAVNEKENLEGINNE